MRPLPKLTTTLESVAPVLGVTVNETGAPTVCAPLGTDSVTVVAERAVMAAVPALPPAVAVTVALSVVESVVVATPRALVTADVAANVPAVVVNATGTPTIGLPEASSTRADTVTVPPEAGTLVGAALTSTRSAAAAPMVTSSVLLAPPENAVSVALPDRPSAISLTVTLPLFVRASAGSILPRVVVNDTSVPLWTGVPEPAVALAPVPVEPFSMSTATTSVEPLIGNVLEVDTRVMTVPAGASSGTLSQATKTRGASVKRPSSTGWVNRRGTIRIVQDLTFMPIEGQGSSPFDDRGFTMVVLLVVIAVMGIGMTAMLPTWRQQSIREKEEELIFRGNQYARAIALYARKNNNVLPANVDVLVDGKYLRRRWKDPITGTDFGLLPAGQPANAGRGVPQGPGATGGAPGGARGGGAPVSMGGQQPGGRGVGPGSQVGQQIVGSFQGVYSTSSDTSIRVYQNQQRYIDWQFTVQTANVLMGQQGRGGPQPGRAGGPADGRGGPGGARGNPGGLPGRGQPQGPGRGTPTLPGGPGGRGRGGL